MRRTSRLVLLLGIFLAALTFVVVLLLGQAADGTRHRRRSASAPTTAAHGRRGASTSRSGPIVTAGRCSRPRRCP